jgi:hypothetical protein
LCNKRMTHVQPITFLKEKSLKAFTWNVKDKETFIQLCNKRMTHVQPITFLKEKSPNHPC